MSREDDAFLKRLLATFGIEAEEHLKAMSQLLLALEKSAPPEPGSATVEALFREAHSLKGAARSVNLAEVEGICRALESFFAKLKRGEVALSAPCFDILFRAFDQLRLYLAADAAQRPPWDPLQLAAQIEALERNVPDGTAPQVETAGNPVAARHQTTPPALPFAALAEPQLAPDTVRIATAKLGALLTQVEELLAFKFNAGHLVGELAKIRTLVSTRTRHRAGRERRASGPINGEHHNGAIPLPEAGESEQRFAKALEDQLGKLGHEVELERRALSGMLDNLLDEMKQALMLPASTLLEWAPKLVRDLARDSGKEVELQLHGGSIEIDRRILEQLKAPLIHLLRNAVDHGIETPAERRRRNKHGQGLVSIEVQPRDGNKIELRISDDGAGPNLEKIKDQAFKTGLATADALAHFMDDETMSLMFESGLSTSSMLTDVSGRGLGLAIVREKIERIGGHVSVEKPASGGTRFRLVLPTTLANFHGLLVAVGEHRFVLPSLNLECVIRVPDDAVKTVENRDTIELNGQVLPLVKLGDVLQLKQPVATQNASGQQQIAVLGSAGRRVAFSVDAILGDQEVLVRSLGPQLRRVRNVSGATVLGAGQVVLILNPSDLLKSALKWLPAQAGAAAPPVASRKSVLVVEDSITSRALIKNILESAGYLVTGAVDGLDGITCLRTGTFDLVVSDVEMPRMDGFSLTSQIRSDKKLAELPVILVTALDTREHKERGIEVGANAYIVKSSFDQSNLLDAVKRLI